jgi:hypothetical protein
MPASGSYTSAVKVFKIMPEENCILKSNKKAPQENSPAALYQISSAKYGLSTN